MSKVRRASLGHYALAALEGHHGRGDRYGDHGAVAYVLLGRTLLLLAPRSAWAQRDSAALGVVERHTEARTIAAFGVHEGRSEDSVGRSFHSCRSFHLLAGACKARLACLQE